YGLAQQSSGEHGSAAHILNGLGVTTDKLEAMRQTGSRDPSANLDLSDGVKQTLERAAAIAQQRGDKKLASAHLLAGSLADSSMPLILGESGTTIDAVQSALDGLDVWTDEA